MRYSLAIAAVAAAALVAPASGLAAKAPRAGLPGSAPSAHHHPGAGRPDGRARAHASFFYTSVSSYCYGRTVSAGGGGSVVFTLDRLASFGFPPGTSIRWRPWVVWSNTSGTDWWTNSGYYTYTVANSGATGDGVYTYHADGSVSTTIGGTAAPGVSTTALLPIAPRTWARPYLELIINGRTYWNPLTPNHGDWPATPSGDWCSFA